jgi:transcriptional regulator with XRE-family HTH domain
MVTIGSRLRRLRQERSITQSQLAKLIGVRQSHISKIENNRSSVSIETLEKIANALGVSPGKFIDGDPPVASGMT